MHSFDAGKNEVAIEMLSLEAERDQEEKGDSNMVRCRL